MQFPEHLLGQREVPGCQQRGSLRVARDDSLGELGMLADQRVTDSGEYGSASKPN